LLYKKTSYSTIDKQLLDKKDSCSIKIYKILYVIFNVSIKIKSMYYQ